MTYDEHIQSLYEKSIKKKARQARLENRNKVLQEIWQTLDKVNSSPTDQNNWNIYTFELQLEKARSCQPESIEWACSVMGVSSSWSAEKVRSQYVRWVRCLHPDGSSDLSQKKRLTEATASLNAAWNILRNHFRQMAR